MAVLRLILVFASVTACGRIGFEPSEGSAGALSIRYADVRPVYMVGVAIPPLTPTVTGTPTELTVTPDLPPGLALDPLTGVIDGTPTAVSPPTPYTVTATDGATAATTAITLRTADGFVVNSNLDTVDATIGDGVCETASGNGQCTLRAAVAELNASSTRSVAYILPQTITLASVLPNAMRSMELVGESQADVVIDASGVGPMIAFGDHGVRLTLSDLTYRNGSAHIYHNFRQGLALVADHIRVVGCTQFSDLPTQATLRIVDSTFEANTDTLVTFSGDTATIDRSTFVDNTGNVDGTLYFIYGDVTITNSTFARNTGDAGAVLFNNATATVTHNTFADNVATGAFRGGAASQYSGATSTWTNNLVVNNTGTQGACNLSGVVTSRGGNLGFPADNDTSPCYFDDASDPAPVDPRIAPLADNGGLTRTVAIPVGSPALDAAATAGCLAIDQRGVARPQGARCDIGAFELAAP